MANSTPEPKDVNYRHGVQVCWDCRHCEAQNEGKLFCTLVQMCVSPNAVCDKFAILLEAKDENQN